MKLNRINPASLSATALSKASGRINDGGGLALIPNYKGNAGQHRWVFRSTHEGKAFEMGLGTLAEVNLATARELADAARKDVGKGIDPRKAKQDKRADEAQAIEDARRARLNLPVQNSVKDWATRYMAKQASSWGGKGTADEFTGQLENHVFPAIGNLKISDISTQQVTDVLNAAKARAASNKAGKDGSPLMHAVLKKLRVIFQYAVLSKAITSNPCDGQESLIAKLKTGNNPAVETAEALRAVLHAFDACASNTIMKTAMAAQVYLFQRSTITVGMQWAHVNLSRAKWTVPAELMKGDAEDKENGEAHEIHLPRQMVVLLTALKEITGGGAFCFPNATDTTRHMQADSLNNAMQSAMGKRKGKAWTAYQTAHGFRAVGISFGQRYVGLDKRVLDIVAGHKLGDNLGTSYERNEWHEERAPALQAFADWIDALRAGDESAVLTHGERTRAQAATAPAISAEEWAEFQAFRAMRAAMARPEMQAA